VARKKKKDDIVIISSECTSFGDIEHYTKTVRLHKSLGSFYLDLPPEAQSILKETYIDDTELKRLEHKYQQRLHTYANATQKEREVIVYCLQADLDHKTASDAGFGSKDGNSLHEVDGGWQEPDSMKLRFAYAAMIETSCSTWDLNKYHLDTTKNNPIRSSLCMDPSEVSTRERQDGFVVIPYNEQVFRGFQEIEKKLKELIVGLKILTKDPDRLLEGVQKLLGDSQKH